MLTRRDFITSFIHGTTALLLFQSKSSSAKTFCSPDTPFADANIIILDGWVLLKSDLEAKS